MAIALLVLAEVGCQQASAPPVGLVVIDRQGYDQVLAKHRGKVILVDFWATWCHPCVRQFPHTVEMSRKFEDRGLAVVSVSLDNPDQSEKTRQFLQAIGASFDNLLSKYGVSQESMTSFDVEGGTIPHYKLYDRKGNLRASFSTDPQADQQFTPEDIERRVVELLAEGNG